MAPRAEKGRIRMWSAGRIYPSERSKITLHSPSQRAEKCLGLSVRSASSLRLQKQGRALPKEPGGFSLLELIIVLIIISLLALLVTPKFAKTLSHMEVKSAAKKIGSILRYCRNDAVNRNRVYQVNFDTGSNLISVLWAAEGEDKLTMQNSYPLPRDVRVEKVDAGKTLFENTLPSFEFYPNGGANGGTAVVRGGEGRGYAIRVDFLTGLVKIEGTKE
jgi:prepilin-type N-terminal cleavage/methylation domain-containing protein